MISRRDALKLGAAGMVAPALAGNAPQPAIAAQEQGGSVPMFRGNAARTGEMPGPGPSLDKPIVIKWKFDAEEVVQSTPAVVDGVAYFANVSGVLYALDTVDGSELWRFGASASVRCSPAVHDGLIFFGNEDGNVYAVESSSGKEQWRKSIGGAVRSSPVVLDGLVYFGSEDGRLYALEAASGSEAWHFTTSGPISSSPAVVNGVVMVGSKDNNLYAINSVTGSELWRFSCDSPIVTTPAVANNTAHISSLNYLYSLDVITGSENWRFPISTSGDSSPAISNGSVLIGSGEGILYSIDSQSGDDLWRVSIPDFEVSSPAVVDDVVLVGSYLNLLALHLATGQQAWSLSADEGAFVCGPVIDGVAYVSLSTTAEGHLYALGNLADTILLNDVTLRGAPSSSSVERGTAKAGDIVVTVGPREEREGQVWSEVIIGDVTGWIPLDAIDPATLPPEGEIEYVYIPE